MENSKDDKLYMLFGKFLINFEYISLVMRNGILRLIFPDYSDGQERQIEILLEGLTADQIRNKYLALIVENYKDDSEVVKLAKTISKVFLKLIPMRNSFAHGTSFIGQRSAFKESAEGKLLLRHAKIKKIGLDLNFKKYEIEALSEAIFLVKQTYAAVAHLTVTIALKTDTTEEGIKSLTKERLSLEEVNKKYKISP